jgi:aarF domain-containing kinase
MLRRLASELFVTRRRRVAAFGTAAVLAVASDEGLSRSVYFNAHALPALAHYRLVEWTLRRRNASEAETAAALQPLHEKYAPMALHVILKLRGFYIKARARRAAPQLPPERSRQLHERGPPALAAHPSPGQLGQIGATRSDFVAKEYVERCETLQARGRGEGRPCPRGDLTWPQDACPFESLPQVEKLLEAAFGRPAREVFASIEATPLGAASIGQVHRALLHDGRWVAVKVQYPRVEALFRGDLRTIRRFCQLAQPEHLAVLDEVERAFLTEFDYTREAAALSQVCDNVAAAPFAHAVAVPRPVRELCTRRVLVMTFLDGEKLVDALRRRATQLAASRGMTLAQLRAQWADAAWGSSDGPPPCAPRPSPAWRRAALRCALWLADAAHNAPRMLANATVRRLMRQPPLVLRASTPPPMDVEGTLALLSQVHAHQIFADGLFNGDAHPGNVLLLRDGRIGLIDYGQACRMEPEDRVRLARLIRALSQGPAAAAEARAYARATSRAPPDACSPTPSDPRSARWSACGAPAATPRCTASTSCATAPPWSHLTATIGR